MITNSKIGSRPDLLNGLISGTGKLPGTKAAIVSLSDMSALLHENIDSRLKLPRFYFSFSIYLL